MHVCRVAGKASSICDFRQNISYVFSLLRALKVEGESARTAPSVRQRSIMVALCLLCFSVVDRGGVDNLP